MAERINDSDLALAQYLNASIAKTRQTLDGKEKQEALLEDVSARLGTAKICALAYRADRAVARADDDMADAEEHFLSSVRAVFEIRP